MAVLVDRGWYSVCEPDHLADGERMQPLPVSILLLHGSTVNRGMWLPQIRAFGDRFRMVLPDLPGHGKLADEPFRIGPALDRLEKLLEQESMQPVVMVGVSLGGHLAALLAARCPEKTAGLVLSGASMDFHGLTGLWVRLAAFLITRSSQEKSKERLVRNIRARWPAEAGDEMIRQGLAPLGAAQSFRELPGYNFLKTMRLIRAPVLILNGETDRANRKGEAAFAAAAPNGRAVVVSGAGHACSLENPELYNRLLLDFLLSLQSAGKG